jgi:hypothetical protein
MRFLLEDKNAEYRKFVQSLSGDIDAAIPELIKASTLEDLISGLDYMIEFHDDDKLHDYMKDRWSELKINSASYGGFGGYATTRDKKVLITQSQWDRFQSAQKALHSRIKNA